MKLQELIENPVAPAQPAAAAPAAPAGNKFVRGAEKVAGAIDTIGGIAGKINKIASGGKDGGALSGINTGQLKIALSNVLNKKALTRQDLEVLTQTFKNL
jgi:hypothetical protein